MNLEQEHNIADEVVAELATRFPTADVIVHADRVLTGMTCHHE